MDASVQRRTLLMVFLFAAVYLVVGIAFHFQQCRDEAVQASVELEMLHALALEAAIGAAGVGDVLIAELVSHPVGDARGNDLHERIALAPRGRDSAKKLLVLTIVIALLSGGAVGALFRLTVVHTTAGAIAPAVAATLIIAVAAYATTLQTILEHFLAVTNPVLAGAPAPPAEPATLVGDLRQAEEMHAWATAQETEHTRWSERFGPSYQGLATDWDALRLALDWTKRLRGLFASELPPVDRRAGSG